MKMAHPNYSLCLSQDSHEADPLAVSH
uniref:Uncharacterized protein n=1 Tax=Anguilla anguilla TaxID=7936 RepID=A0A0E9V1B8_ANGAN